MTTLEQYIKDKYGSSSDWFVEYVNEIHNQMRINDVLAKKEYLNGSHKILKSPSYQYNGKEFHPRKIVLQYAKTLLNFQKAYLLQNPITLTGNEKVVREYQKVNRKGKYNRLNQKILDKVLKYGQVAEYVYLDNGVIKSKLIDPSHGYPIHDEHNQLIGFIQAFVNDGISYYTVYEEDVVSEYNNAGGRLKLTGRYANLSGLPIVYHNDNELSDIEGRSELDDWISILDSMEDLISKYTDSFYKFMNPVPVSIGMQLKGEGLPSNIVGGGISLDDGADFKLVSNGLDYQSFETIYKTLLQSLLDISQTPAVSMNKTDISNLSEVSIKLLFQLANIKASGNEQFIREGLEQRFNKIRRLLELQGITFSDDDYDTLDIVFQYATPANDTEIIANLKELRGLGAISLESLLGHSPYVSDIQMELQKIDEENNIQYVNKLDDIVDNVNNL
ncbi:phage portal protein [Caldibacillus sp. 210928-DFI.2.22]|uniref:phage portal protein n=1 Tax=unclassified Caldibacillus TaxID=2641266 RepID=UPI001D0688EE|nr:MULTISPECIES: phage portal protein [unclassified Caldibacillus]MCB7070563.1 phage portal protein [Caldibacillus sp. 210928-DFI.2.22]MCB7073729.1 phage portal protein [Caldibacillus sp. 210928-DFI.2.18]